MMQPSSSLQPVDYVPAFTWDRLIAVARILWDSRAWVAADAKPQLGDTRTGIGFRSWEHGKHAVTVAAATQFAAWLSVVDGGPRFTFMYGGAPIRWYRGDTDQPVPDNYADPDEIEREQLGLFFATNHPAIAFDGYYRMIMKADNTGVPLAIFLAGVDFGNVVRMVWEIPVAATGTGATPITVPQAPLPLPPLTVLTVAEAGNLAREEAERIEREREAQKRAREDKNNTDTKGA